MLATSCLRLALRRPGYCALQASTRSCYRRSISTTALDPVVRGFASALAEKQPCFSLPAQNVRILHEPHSFYTTLLDMIRHARRRIFLSSLYIGEGEHELIETLRTALDSNASLQVHIHLDLNRSTRPGPNSPVNILLPLLEHHPDRVHISLFRSPALRGVLSRLVPPRFNEGWGTWHAKIYGADDDVLISGANLNRSYFTDRQDRYVRFNAHARLADYCCAYLDAAAGFSYRLLRAPASARGYELHWPSSAHPHRFHARAESSLRALQSTFRGVPNKSMDGDVLVFPVLQAGQFGLREEVECLALLFQHIAQQQAHGANPVMDLTSGYFGLSTQYRALVLESAVDCRILAASPQANGFYGSSGISGRIPEGYTLLEQRFMRAVARAGRAWAPASPRRGVELTEWARSGWTYHAKGVWLSPSTDANPVFTLLGSTNLSARSAELDSELSFAVLTGASALRAGLVEEVRALRAHARPWAGEERKVRLGTRALVGLVGNML